MQAGSGRGRSGFLTEEEKAARPKVTAAFLKRIASYLLPYWKQLLLKDPAVVVFDEATSSLDSIAEALIQEAIGPMIAQRTGIVIAHRLSTVLAADEILVMQEGRIVQRGRHAELLEQGGLYARLYETQFGGADGQEELS